VEHALASLSQASLSQANLSQANSILAVLEGGPDNFPEASRTQVVGSLTQKIKVPNYGGYEHFERISPIEEDRAHIIFRWTMRTEVAE
jgi:hypothetical protein